MTYIGEVHYSGYRQVAHADAHGLHLALQVLSGLGWRPMPDEYAVHIGDGAALVDALVEKRGHMQVVALLVHGWAEVQRARAEARTIVVTAEACTEVMLSGEPS